MRNRSRIFVLVTFAFAIAVPAFGQVDRATLEGTVKDSSGGLVSGAEVKITETRTGLTDHRATNEFGEYRFPGIAFGVYTLEVSR